MSDRAVRSGVYGAVVALVVAALVVGVPAVASAATYSATVRGTGGIGLNVRSAPTASSARVGGLPEGAAVVVDCYGYGDTVAGYWYTGNLWQHIVSPVNGWVTDTYLYTGYNGPIPGEPQCGSTPPPPPAAAPKPTSTISFPPSPYAPPRPKAPRSSVPPPGAAALVVACQQFANSGFKASASTCRHYSNASGSMYFINAGDLIWEQRPLWASLEYWLRQQVGQKLSTLKATPANGAYSTTFSSGWQGYNATSGDFYGALGRFVFIVTGDVWIGPADSSGIRPVQVRYRSGYSDVYNFNPASAAQKPFYDAATKGWAAEFWTWGDTKAITIQTTSQLDASTLGFRW